MTGAQIRRPPCTQEARRSGGDRRHRPPAVRRARLRHRHRRRDRGRRRRLGEDGLQPLPDEGGPRVRRARAGPHAARRGHHRAPTRRLRPRRLPRADRHRDRRPRRPRRRGPPRGRQDHPPQPHAAGAPDRGVGVGGRGRHRRDRRDLRRGRRRPRARASSPARCGGRTGRSSSSRCTACWPKRTASSSSSGSGSPPTGPTTSSPPGSGTTARAARKRGPFAQSGRHATGTSCLRDLSARPRAAPRRRSSPG